MSKTIISVNGVWKQYRLGTVGTGTLGNDLKKWWSKASGKGDPFLKIGETNERTSKSDAELMWALQDVSFDVKQGEVLGIIGKNGAGKSTLLKILSRVTAPSKGEIKIRGRIASLLEVGTGFVPDLTGRENVFLNGAILGMRKAEIKSKLDEIIAFSGVERYIDTPVKRYSSGMYVRLAFAVAAHLEPEILVLDEVLAVGDSEFQKKCLSKMDQVSGDGRTVIFVSHNMISVRSICKKGIYLKNGKMEFAGEINDTIEKYTTSLREVSGIALSNREDRRGNGKVVFERILFCNSRGTEVEEISSGDELIIKLRYRSEIKSKASVEVGIAFNNAMGAQVTMVSSALKDQKEITLEENGYFVFTVPKLSLVSGIYSLNLFCRVNNEVSDWVVNTSNLMVTVGDFYKTGLNLDREQSMFLMEYNYHNESI